jgi:hypothetical protein
MDRQNRPGIFSSGSWAGTRISALLAAIILVGCSSPKADCDFVARIGEACLSERDVVAALASVPPGLDSTHAARQIIDRWITDELLSQEALRRNLEEDPEVQKRLQENERAVLISTLVNRLYEDVAPASESEIAAYFERNIDNLRLREPFLRIRYLNARDSSGALEAMAVLDSIEVFPNPDSAWSVAVSNLSQDPEAAAVLSSSYFPSSRFFRNIPYLVEMVTSLAPGESGFISSDRNLYHVIQLVDRVEAGAAPHLEWIIADIENRLIIEKRKQMYVDQVQRLRNRALAEGLLDVRE